MLLPFSKTGQPPDKPLLKTNRRYLVRGLKAEYLRVKTVFRFQGALDVLRLPEAVLFPFINQTGNGDMLFLQGVRHHPRLPRRHDPVFLALKEDDRAGQSVGGMQRRARPVFFFWG